MSGKLAARRTPAEWVGWQTPAAPSRDHKSAGLTAPPGFDASGLTMVYLPGKLLP
jgi:hypothetical protein